MDEPLAGMAPEGAGAAFPAGADVVAAGVEAWPKIFDIKVLNNFMYE